MTDSEITSICYKMADMHGCHHNTALTGICEMIRKGGANKGTPLSFEIEIYCPQENIMVCLQKHDLIRVVQIVCPSKTIRNLADTLGTDIVASGIKRTELYPNLDFSGDLCRKINVRLAHDGRPPLTPKERVGCASYAQNIPNLNEMTGSDTY
jgi:hypothetical protein